MIMYMKLGPVVADDIDSGAAENGQVLTANGSGGVVWAESAGGGGGGVLWDDVDFSIGELLGDGGEDPYGRGITFTLTLNGEPISEDTLVMATLLRPEDYRIIWNPGYYVSIGIDNEVGKDNRIGFIPYFHEVAPITIFAYGYWNGPTLFTLFKPNGGIVVIPMNLGHS